MPPSKAYRTRSQKGQRSILDYNQGQAQLKTRRARSNAKVERFKLSRSDEDEGQDDKIVIEAKNTSTVKTKASLQQKGKGKVQQDTDSEPEVSSPSRSKEKSSTEAEDELPIPITRKARRSRTIREVIETDSDFGASAPIAILSGKENDSDEVQSVKPSRSLVKKTRQRTLLEYGTPAKNSGRRTVVKPSSEVYRSESSESDSPRKVRFEPPSSSFRAITTVQSDSSPESQEDAENSGGPPRRKRLGQRPHPAIEVHDVDSGSETLPVAKRSRSTNTASSDDDGDGKKLGSFSPSKRRRLVKGKRPTGIKGQLSSDDEQLIEEAEEEESVLSTRFRDRSKKKDYVRHLENLKRKRKGEKSVNEEEEDEEEDYASGEAASAHSDIFADAKPSQSYISDHDAEDEEEDDFIVEDDEEAIELPPMFNMSTFQDLSHHFKVVCQLFVHLSIKKRGHRTKFMKEALENVYFSVPLNMTRRKLLGLRDSLVASSIWKPEFRKPLETYPEFALQQLDFAVPHCDACNLSSRISTLQGVLRGERYDRNTYQNKGKEITLDWNLGRFCAARAQVFHKLTHWEYALFHRLDLEIDHLRKKVQDHDVNRHGQIFIPATKGPPPPEDLDDADGLMEWLDGRGIIEAEWLEIKAMTDKAHKLEAKGKGGEDDVEYS